MPLAVPATEPSRAPSLFAPPLPAAGQQRAWWRAPASASALALALASAARCHRGLVLAVTRDSHAAQTLEQDLSVFAGDLPVMHFPDWETLPYDAFSPHPDIVSQRIAALYRLPSTTRGVLVAPVATLMQRLAPTRYIAGNALMVSEKQRLDLDTEKRRLEDAGYRNVPQVMDPGDFAVRGALIDVYPMGAAAPYRIELLDDEVDSIRSFDPDTQRSAGRVPEVRLLPAREFPLDDASSRRVRELLRERFPIDPRRCTVYQDLKGGTAPAGIEYYLPLFHRNDDGSSATGTLFDYLAPGALVLLADGVFEACAAFWQQTSERFEQRRHDVERPVLPPTELYLDPDSLRTELNALPRIEVCGESHVRRKDAIALGDQPAPALPLVRKDEATASALRDFLASYPGRVLIAADSAGRREALTEQLTSAGLKPSTVASWPEFLEAPLPPGEGLG